MTGGIALKEKETIQEESFSIGGKTVPLVLAYAEIPFTNYSREVARVLNAKDESHLEFYNPSNLFINPKGKIQSPNAPGLYQATRVDYNDLTKSIIFQHLTGHLRITDISYDLEDPYILNLIKPGKNGDRMSIVLAGVAFDKFVNESGDAESVCVKDVFYYGRNLDELEVFFSGPKGMKDIRFNRIGNALHTDTNFYQDVYTRPRCPENEQLGGDGQIGHTRIDSFLSLEKMSSSCMDINHAPLIRYRFTDGKWGGVSDSELIKEGPLKGWNLLLIHEAYKTFQEVEQQRHYSIGWLFHNPITEDVIDPGVRIRRSALPDGPWKNQHISKDLWDVLFGTGFRLVENHNYPLGDFSKNFALVFTGVSDTRSYVIKTPHPGLYIN